MSPVDYHLHTRLCGHASGELEEYLEQAVRLGIREVGFSDHLPLYFLPPGKTIPDYAMGEEELPLYVEMVQNCARKFPLRVSLGIEADCSWLRKKTGRPSFPLPFRLCHRVGAFSGWLGV